MLYCQIFKRFLLSLLTLSVGVVVPWNNRVKQIRTLFRHSSAISCSGIDLSWWCMCMKRKTFECLLNNWCIFHSHTFSLFQSSFPFGMRFWLWVACYASAVNKPIAITLTSDTHALRTQNTLNKKSNIEWISFYASLVIDFTPHVWAVDKEHWIALYATDFFYNVDNHK